VEEVSVSIVFLESTIQKTSAQRIKNPFNDEKIENLLEVQVEAELELNREWVGLREEELELNQEVEAMAKTRNSMEIVVWKRKKEK
jgi:folate-dependent tRNA-U54 methylase TrmFO/GidA